MDIEQPQLAGVSGLLLAATAGAGDVLVLFVLFLLAAVVALAGFYAAVAIRRWSQREVRATTFTFQDLRDMRSSGQISDREFVAMRAALLAELELDERDEAGPSETPSKAPPDDTPDGGSANAPEDDVPPVGPEPPAP
jgi:hypothetical protein